MRPQTSKLLRALVAGLALSGLAATAQEVVVVVGPVDPVAEPVAQPKKPTFTALIAAASLAQQGVTDPTSTDLGVAESNVQAMRDSGMGWGEIANSLNLRLGDVVSAANKSPRAIKTTPITSSDTEGETSAVRFQRPAKGGKQLAAAGDTSNRGQSAGRAGGSNSGGGKSSGGASNGGGSGGGGKGGGAGNGGGKGGAGGGRGGGNGGGKGGGNGGGKGGGNR
ncbi:MAG: hypothetical protein MUF76_07960 [Hydrogenophaga sp.]|jgi:hypothetical protein|nr:hypothetical protein [Hydrogenophaga sp.]